MRVAVGWVSVGPRPRAGPGGKAVLTIPSELAYGPMNVGTIPGNSALQFEVELLEIAEAKEGGLFGMFAN